MSIIFLFSNLVGISGSESILCPCFFGLFAVKIDSEDCWCSASHFDILWNSLFESHYGSNFGKHFNTHFYTHSDGQRFCLRTMETEHNSNSVQVERNWFWSEIELNQICLKWKKKTDFRGKGITRKDRKQKDQQKLHHSHPRYPAVLCFDWLHITLKSRLK